MLNNLPDGIRAEALLEFLQMEEVQLKLVGSHNRNVCHDIEGMSQFPGGKVQVSLARKGIYDLLPEFCFHVYDRFASLYNDDFKEELDRQQKEMDLARAFFEPVDLSLMALRSEVFRQQQEYASTNRVLIDLLTDGLTEQQKQNRFIRNTFPFLPYLRRIRGNRTFITWMLRKVFEDEGLKLRLEKETRAPGHSGWRERARAW